MNPEGHVEIYRVAFDAANSELTEIDAEFERLRTRKDQLEKLVIVLRSLLPDDATTVANPPAEEQQIEITEIAAEASSEMAPEGSEEPAREREVFTADPFQRRIDHVLGIGAGIRDVRKYTRQF